MTRSALNRFGLFDENIYPTYFEDNDFQLRQQRMNPPMKVQVLPDVVLHHGKPQDRDYHSAILHTADHEHAEKHIRNTVTQRTYLNGQYLFRKWGCREQRWFDCDYKTPFNKSLPIW
jgi:GT2 family glycosyltransferase